MHEPLEIHIPIQPTPVDLTRLRYLAASLTMYGGHLGGSSLVVTVGADEEPRDLDAELPWARSLPLEWRWIEREEYRRWGPTATRLERFTYDFRARHVLMLEPDTLVVASLNSLVSRVLADRALAGVPAEAVPPEIVPAPAPGEPEGEGPAPPSVFDPAVLIAPQRWMRRLGRGVGEALESTADIDPEWRTAAAIAHIVGTQEIPTAELPHRFNFVNDRGWMTRFHADSLDLRIIRYCRHDQFDPQIDFADADAVDALLLRSGWNEANTALTLRLNRVHHYVKAHRDVQSRMGVATA